MPDFNPRPPITSDSSSVTMSPCTQPTQGNGVPSYSSMSYTVVNATPVVVQSNVEPPRPLNEATIRVINSVFHAKVNEAAIRRDESEDF